MVVEAWATAVTGAFLSASLSVLFERLAKVKNLQLLNDVMRGTTLRVDLLQEMEMLLLRMGKVLGDAEEKQIMSPLIRRWVDKLKEAVYDAEDLPEAIAVADEGQVQEVRVQDFNTHLEEIVSELNVIAAERILVFKEGQEQGVPRLPTTSLLDKYEECLRDDDKKLLLEVLLSDGENRKGIPVIAIAGMGGIGKTTLVQFLYNDIGVKKYFKLRIWVHVSENFDVFKVTKTIYESTTFSHFDIEDLNALQVKLEHELIGKRFLLVLDNVWNKNATYWDLLLRPSQVGALGSKIVITTRSQDISSIMHGVLVHNLKTLSEENSWSLFVKHAFGDKDPDEDSFLKAIGQEIVSKCKGLPLAIKTHGSLLYSQVDATEWNNILNSKIWDLPLHKSDILPTLILSYRYLPSHLKRCFAYCSIFPKGHEFGKGDLVRMWIAEGLVQQPDNGKTSIGKEELGEQYFHELVSSSIFQPSDQAASCFKMHDLVSDLAQHIAGEFCYKLEDDCLLQNPAIVRHLSCILKPSDSIEKLNAFCGKNKLRTFLALKSQDECSSTFYPTALEMLLPASNCLRVLSLSASGINEFPGSLCNLIQLCYLDLSGANFELLREGSVSCLSNLETLKLSSCINLMHLPADLSKLTKFEYLDVSNTNLVELLDSIGDLNKLSYLDLSRTQIPSLPDRVCDLGNLKTLKLSGCSHLTCLPRNLN